MTHQEPHELARTLASDYSTRNLNEADTRPQIIDRILHEIIDWPRTRVACEEYVQPGYADYVFRKGSGDVVFLLEAKKEGDYFSLPAEFSS